MQTVGDSGWHLSQSQFAIPNSVQCPSITQISGHPESPWKKEKKKGREGESKDLSPVSSVKNIQIQEARGKHGFGCWLCAVQRSHPLGYIPCKKLPLQRFHRHWSLQYFVLSSSHRRCGRGKRSLLVGAWQPVLPVGNATVRGCRGRSHSPVTAPGSHSGYFWGQIPAWGLLPFARLLSTYYIYILHKTLFPMLQEKESLSSQLRGATLAFAVSAAWSRTLWSWGVCSWQGKPRPLARSSNRVAVTSGKSAWHIKPYSPHTSPLSLAGVTKTRRVGASP